MQLLENIQSLGMKTSDYKRDTQYNNITEIQFMREMFINYILRSKMYYGCIQYSCYLY